MSYSLPKKNTAFIFYLGLVSQADTKLLQLNPTIAAGDFKVAIDGAATANPATLPAVTPAGGSAVKVSLSAAEMNGDNITVTAIDAAGAEWCSQLINIQTTTNQVDDLFSTTLADSVPADGTKPSATQALYMITQYLFERAVSSTTVTVKKVDGSTTLMTLTLDNATTPTSVTRTT